MYVGPGPGDADGDDAAGDGDDVRVDQQLSAAGGVHQGHRRLVWSLRLLRL